jgi:hypothetical protein
MAEKPQVKQDAILKVGTDLTPQQIQKFFTATPKDKIKQRPAKGGGHWDYVSGSYVTQVLNSLFAYNWSFEVITSMQEALATANTGTVVVQGRLKVKIGGEWITKEQYGRKDVAFKKGTDTPLDFGNDLKAAATDAKKKCASELGLFADVYSQEDFFEATIVDGESISAAELEKKFSEEIKKLTTSAAILEYLGKLSIEEKRIASPIVDKHIEELNAKKA